MICKHYGRDYGLEPLSRLCPSSADGVSLLAISRTLETLGMETEAVSLTLEELSADRLPCILHWDQNHFVVLYRVRRGQYYLADPGRGLVRYAAHEFLSHWAVRQADDVFRGISLLVRPTATFIRREGKGGSESRSFAFLAGYIKQYRRQFGRVILGLFVGCLIQLAFPFLTQAIVDVGIARRDIHIIYLILAGQLMLTFSRTGVNFMRRRILLRVSTRINISLVSDFFIKLLRLPMSFFDTKLTGDLIQRMGDHGRVERFLTSQALSTLFSALSFVVFGVVLLCYNLRIFLIFLVGSLCYGGWIVLFLRRRKQLDYLRFDVMSRTNGKIYQFITSMQEIKLQDCERRRREEWEALQGELFEVSLRGLRLQQAQEVGSMLINETKNIIITVTAATAVVGGAMTLGMMLAVQYIIGQLHAPVEQIMKLIYSLQDIQIGLERINEIHRMDDEDGDPEALTLFPPEDRSLRLRHVDFKYDPHAPAKTLDGVDCVIPEGHVTAIVGTSGSGKTTLIKLLLGYYAPQSGQVLIGQTDLMRFQLKWWRRQCGVVMQDGVIFSESIARNIAVSDGPIDEDRLHEAARVACIDGYVDSLPLGYATRIGADGIGLSQGQKQRILIARAVYKNPQFIFLDEATNALDAVNERAIVDQLRQFYRGRTVVIVAHRLSTVRHADQIVVMDCGRIVEVGTHQQLIARRGEYFQLVKNQLELEQ